MKWSFLSIVQGAFKFNYEPILAKRDQDPTYHARMMYLLESCLVLGRPSIPSVGGVTWIGAIFWFKKIGFSPVSCGLWALSSVLAA